LDLIASAFLLFAASAMVQAVPLARDLRNGLTGAGAACGCMILVLVAAAHAGGILDPDPHARVAFGAPGLGGSLLLDPLGAVGLVIVGMAGLAASIHAIGYARAQSGGHAATPVPMMPLLPIFVAAMALVPLAADVFTLVFAFEAMSVVSWILVLSGHREPGGREAGPIYLITAVFGTLCLVLSLALLGGPEGAWHFATMRETDVGPLRTAAAVILAILGAGSKAGLFPLHVWLPLAHPAAPSPISALMSGAMTKMALLVLVRILFDLAGPPAAWWGTLLMVIGLASAVMGVLYALMQDDIKRLLAYSTVENVGLVAVGLGVALQFQASGLPVVAVVALTAALLHMVNHALFKTLLFLAAGSVTATTGHRGLDRLGGLMRAMPVTGVVALLGSLAIAGLPPLNGFASEWLTFQALLDAARLPQWELKMALAAAAAGLALVAALSAVCFVRAFGIAFLGRPRSVEAATAHEADRTMRAGMAIPAALCILFGLFPMLPVALVAPAVLELVPGATSADIPATVLWLVSPGASQGYAPWALAAVGAALGIAVWLALRPVGRAAVRRVPAWGCGHPPVGPVAQYGGASFAQPIRRVFATTAFAARETVDMPAPGDVRPARFALHLVDPAWEAVVRPLSAAIDRLAGYVNALQSLTIRAYLSITFATLVVLLLVTAVVR
jgi:hydrogenase-4 component B